MRNAVKECREYLIRSNGYCLGAFISLLITVSWGYYLVPGVALLVAVMTLPFWGREWRWLDEEDLGWCLALSGYAALWLADVARTGHWPAGEQGWGVALPVWPLVAALLLTWMRCRPPAPDAWWAGIGCGALGAGSIALFERLIEHQERADNGMNAIPFGDLSLLLGSLSLLAALYWPMRSGHACRYSTGSTGLTLLAALGGLLASLLSGTRGGWIALPLMAGLLLLAHWRGINGARSSRPLRYGVWGGAVMILVIAVLPQSGVVDRLIHAWSQSQAYALGEDRTSSVGLRLEMWRGGWQLFQQRPWFGWGEGRLMEAMQALADQGRIHPDAVQFGQLHSDIIDTLARRGIAGLIALAGLYGVPIWLFTRRLQHHQARVRVLAVAGLMITTAFILFGLTQTLLRDVRGLSGYLGLSIGCWVVMRGEELDSRASGRVRSP
ncbi:O-antigen ligase family protein [Modicisalibacter tunisiensis]|nr:O-antigen ligase family protein [Modicisalibacter tunisiensis]